jgi:hypothetical protein
MEGVSQPREVSRAHTHVQLITNAKNFLNSDEGKKLGKCSTAEMSFIH